MKAIKLLCICVMFTAVNSCKKHKEPIQAPSAKPNTYKDSGYTYLFSIGKGQADSLSPVFFEKMPSGDVKFIMGEWRGGTKQNVSRLYNGKINNWNLPALDLAKVTSYDAFRLDEDGRLHYETFYKHPKMQYSEASGLMSSVYSTSLGDLLAVGRNYYYNFKSSNYKELNILNYTNGSFLIRDSFVYESSLFEFNKKSYLFYSETSDPEGPSSRATVHVKIHDKNGLSFENDFESGDVVDAFDGGQESYLAGKFIRPMEIPGKDPALLLCTDGQVNQMYDRTVTFMPSIKEDNFRFPTFKYASQYMKYFFYKDFLYGSSNAYSYLARTTFQQAFDVPLRLQRVRGIFGSTKGIIVVVENDEKGLDVLELNL